MTQWSFVIAAYVVGAVGMGAMLVESWWSMRRAEAAADKVRRK